MVDVFRTEFAETSAHQLMKDEPLLVEGVSIITLCHP